MHKPPVFFWRGEHRELPTHRFPPGDARFPRKKKGERGKNTHLTNSTNRRVQPPSIKQEKGVVG